MGASPRGYDPVQPRRAGPPGRRGDDFYGYAALKWLREGNQLFGHPRRNTMIADITMYCIGKVERARAFGQLKNISPWSEYINFIREQIDLDVFDKF